MFAESGGLTTSWITASSNTIGLTLCAYASWNPNTIGLTLCAYASWNR